MKVIIVGGVAGGASCAARLRRLDEKAEILMVERGPYVSYANCGLPYHVSGVIEQESSLLVATEQTFRTPVQHRRAHALRGHQHLAQREDRPAQEPCHRRGDHREVRQARALARRRAHPPAPARHRPARRLLGAHRARCPRDQAVGRTDLERPDRGAHAPPASSR